VIIAASARPEGAIAATRPGLRDQAEKNRNLSIAEPACARAAP
jgi:hypothetical protein